MGFPQPGTGLTAHFLEALSLCWIAVRQCTLANRCQLFQENDITGTVLSWPTKLLEQGVHGDLNVGGAQHRANPLMLTIGPSMATIETRSHRKPTSVVKAPLGHPFSSGDCKDVRCENLFLVKKSSHNVVSGLDVGPSLCRELASWF